MAEVLPRQNPAGLETLRRVAMIQSTEASNAIENIHAPRARIEALVAEKTTPENRSEQEIAGYRDVLATIHANGANIPFEPRYVEQLHGTLHSYVGDRDAGHWKRIDNEVSEARPDGTRVVRFTPVSAALTPEAMQDLHSELTRALQAGTYSPLLLCAAYVLDFTVIHPFRDGNGRMSRLITLWLLYIVGHDVGRYISIEQLIDNSRETYYEALRRSTEGWHDSEHDLEPWTSYFLGILLAAYREAREPHRHALRPRLQEGADHYVHRLAAHRRVHGLRGPRKRSRRQRCPHQQGARGAQAGRQHRTTRNRPRRPLAAAAAPGDEPVLIPPLN